MPQEWPFCYWIAVILDHFSRRVQGFMVFERKPDSRTLRSFLGQTIRAVGTAPRHLISDKESMFFCKGFRRWCRRRGIRLRYGAVGKHGSIALIERFFRTLKNECTRRILIPFRRDRMQVELRLFMRWYNGHRPHSALEVQTPNEVYGALSPACRQPRIELRPQWPSGSKCASPQAPRDDDDPRDLAVEVKFLGGRQHLPVVSLRRAA